MDARAVQCILVLRRAAVELTGRTVQTVQRQTWYNFCLLLGVPVPFQMVVYPGAQWHSDDATERYATEPHIHVANQFVPLTQRYPRASKLEMKMKMKMRSKKESSKLLNERFLILNEKLRKRPRCPIQGGTAEMWPFRAFSRAGKLSQRNQSKVNQFFRPSNTGSQVFGQVPVSVCDRDRQSWATGYAAFGSWTLKSFRAAFGGGISFALLLVSEYSSLVAITIDDSHTCLGTCLPRSSKYELQFDPDLFLRISNLRFLTQQLSIRKFPIGRSKALLCKKFVRS